MELHAARVSGHAEFVQVGFTIQTHAFFKREAPAICGTIENASERRHR
jgi:hypothetical protein